MQTLNQYEIHLVSGGNFTQVFTTTIFGLAVGTLLGTVCENGVPLLSPMGEYLLPNIDCVATQTGVGGAIFGAIIGGGWLLANALDNAIETSKTEIAVAS